MAEEEYYTDEEVEEEEVEVVDAPPPAAEPAAEAEPEAEEVEEEGDDVPATRAAVEPVHPKEKVKLRKAPPPQPKEANNSGDTMTEAEKAMMAAKKRHEEEEEAKMVDYEERRRQEREQLEKELEELKIQQQRRQEERRKDEAEFAERRRKDDERRRGEEEARKARIEEEKARREEEKQKRQMMMAGAFAGGYPDGTGPNFTVQKKERPGAVEQSGGRKGRSAEEMAEAKRNYMSIVSRPVDVSNMLPNDIKAKIKQLYARIVKLEGEKYDLEKRSGRQEYDLKEMESRRQQEARNKALKMGLNEEEMQIGGIHPPKILVASKFDRQVDRRGYGDKRELFENPFVKPPASIVHGSGRPPTEWGRKEFEELENIRKNLEPPKYVEQVKAEGEEARPPVPIIPMQIPSGDFEEAPKQEVVPPPAPQKKVRI